MRADELDELKDEMTVRLMVATSSDTALQRYRLELEVGYPAYDPDPASNLRDLQPRDQIRPCASCGRLVVVVGSAPDRRFCDARCRVRDRDDRLRAERRRVAS